MLPDLPLVPTCEIDKVQMLCAEQPVEVTVHITAQQTVQYPKVSKIEYFPALCVLAVLGEDGTTLGAWINPIGWTKNPNL